MHGRRGFNHVRVIVVKTENNTKNKYEKAFNPRKIIEAIFHFSF